MENCAASKTNHKLWQKSPWKKRKKLSFVHILQNKVILKNKINIVTPGQQSRVYQILQACKKSTKAQKLFREN